MTEEISTESWEARVREHYPTVLALARRMLGNDAEARDAAQETFARAWAHIAGFDPSRRFVAWLTAIAVNHVRDVLRRRRGVRLDERFEETLTACSPPDLALLREENRAILRAAVDGLAPDLRIVVHLVFRQELSYTEIADALGISINAVRLRLFRALGILRAALRKEMP